MTKKYLFALFLLGSLSLHAQNEKENIEQLLDSWHIAAAQADSEGYFEKMAENSVFIGTDATENWKKNEFMEWSSPYFKRGEAWDFSVIERNIYLGEDCRIAWFDELLDTHMGICRGSGVLAFEDGQWRIKHYVLSPTVPNVHIEEVAELKKKLDQELLDRKENN